MKIGLRPPSRQANFKYHQILSLVTPPPLTSVKYSTNDSLIYRLYYIIDSNKAIEKNVEVSVFTESITSVSSDNIQIHVHVDLLFVCLFISQSTMTWCIYQFLLFKELMVHNLYDYC